MHYVSSWLAHYFGTNYKISVADWGRKMVDFFSEGGAIYFDEYETRELIQKGESIAWHVNL